MTAFLGHFRDECHLHGAPVEVVLPITLHKPVQGWLDSPLHLTVQSLRIFTATDMSMIMDCKNRWTEDEFQQALTQVQPRPDDYLTAAAREFYVYQMTIAQIVELYSVNESKLRDLVETLQRQTSDASRIDAAT